MRGLFMNMGYLAGKEQEYGYSGLSDISYIIV